jgi:hypothetical protein
MAKEVITLGTKVRFSTYLIRGEQESRVENSWGWHRDKLWFPTDGPIREGIVVGKRTLQNGTRTLTDDGASFKATGHFPAYLVAFDLRRVPVPVRPKDLEIVDD